MAMTFEDQVLGFIKQQNFGGSKAGIGRLALVSKQSGNEEIARAIGQLAKSRGSTDNLNSVGKKVLKSVEDIASKAITADSGSQAVMLKQIKAIEQMLPLIQENNDEQKAAKGELVKFIRSTQKGLTKNATFGNKAKEIARSFLPSFTGIISGLASRNPILGALVGVGVSAYQKRQEATEEVRKEQAESLIEVLQSLGEDKKQSKVTRDRPDSSIKKEPKAQKSEITNGSDMMQDFNKGVIEGMEEELEDAMKGSMGPILKEIYGVSHETMTTAEKIEKLIRATAPSEETEREDTTFRQQQLALMEKMTLNSEKALEGQANMSEEMKNQGSGSMTGNWLLDLILYKSGLSAFAKSFSWIKGPLGKLGGFFSGVGRLMMKIPGAGIVAKAFGGIGKFGGSLLGMLKGVSGLAGRSLGVLFKGLGKLISFPVTFVVAATKGIWDAVDAYTNGSTLSEAAMKGLGGFADFFLFGFLDKIKELIGDNLDFIFEALKGNEKLAEELRPGLLLTRKNIPKGLTGLIGHSEDMQKLADSGIKTQMKKAYTSLPGLIGQVNDHADKIANELKGLAKTPKGFMATKLKSVTETVKKFFLGMVPDWIPSWAFPSSIANELKRARGGVDAPSTISTPSVPSGMRSVRVIPVGTRPSASPSPTRTAVPVAPSSTPKRSTGSSESKSDEQIIDDIIRREGGFNPTDPGGGSMFGVTGLTLAASRGVASVSPEEIQALSEEEARKIYRKEYIAPFADIKDQNLRELAIDTGVNNGPGRAQRWIKDAEGRGLQGQGLYDDVLDTRKKFYDGIVERDPTQARFYPGWMSRLDEFRGRESGSPTMDTEAPQNQGRAEMMRAVDSQATASLNSSAASDGAMKVAAVSGPKINSSNTVNNNTSVMNKRRPMNEEASVIRFMTPVLA
jgi:hypothetical protein